MRKLKIGDFLYTWSEYYGHTIYEVVSIGKTCSRCSENDLIALQIVCNNNFGYDGTLDQMFPYNEKKGIIIYDCEKNIKRSVNQNKMRLFNERQAYSVRQRLLNNQWN